MDRCPDENLLIRWMAGELAPAERDALDRHAAGCDTCRARLAALQRVWDATGELTFAPPARDLTEAVLAAARSAARSRGLSAGVFAFRLAAAVALAVGLGIVAGRLAPPSSPALPSSAAVSEDELFDRTGLDYLAGDNTIIAHVLEMDPAGEPVQEEAS